MAGVLVLGAGNFGTCLAQQLARNEHLVYLWDRSPEVVEAINSEHRNPKYQSDFELLNNIKAFHLLEEVPMADVKAVVICLPTQALRGVLTEKMPRSRLGDRPLICASKGLEISSGSFPLGIIEQVYGEQVSRRAVVLSGPSFAVEVMAQLPTAVSCASFSPDASKLSQELFHSPHFRVYTAKDPVGLEIAGAMKNVIAIAAGASSGLGFQANTRAALISRGLAEMTRIGASYNVDPLVFSGLGGVGDLMLTCTSEKSRNYTVGFKMGSGLNFKQTMDSMDSIAEGVFTVKAAKALVDERNIDAPITNAVYRVLYEDVSVREAVMSLLNRDPKAEYV